jgi:hypothetical protein
LTTGHKHLGAEDHFLAVECFLLPESVGQGKGAIGIIFLLLIAGGLSFAHLVFDGEIFDIAVFAFLAQAGKGDKVIFPKGIGDGEAENGPDDLKFFFLDVHQLRDGFGAVGYNLAFI